MTDKRNKALIFGISGQDGAYLSKFLLDKKYSVYGISRDCDLNPFTNLKKLSILKKIKLRSVSVTDFRGVIESIEDIQPNEIYNLSGQSSVGLSFQQPIETLNSLITLPLNILEAIRYLKLNTRFYQASSGECYGDTIKKGANESTLFHPRSPYGVGKASAHWIVTNYRESFDIFASCGILFNHESPLRPERFVTKKIISGIVDIYEGKRKYLTLGNLDVVRDWGWAPEYVEAMWKILNYKYPEDFIIATGEGHSLKEFVYTALNIMGFSAKKHLKIDKNLYRPNDISYSVGYAVKAKKYLKWKATTRMNGVVRNLLQSELNERNINFTCTD